MDRAELRRDIAKWIGRNADVDRWALADQILAGNTIEVISGVDHLEPYLDGDEYVLPPNLVVLHGTIDGGDKALRYSDGTVLRGFADATYVSSVGGGVVRATNLNNHLIMREFSIVGTGGPCLNLEGTLDWQANLFFVGLMGVNAGTFTGFDVQALKDCYINAASGIRHMGTTNKVFVNRTPFYGITGSAITLDAGLVSSVADIDTCWFKFDGGTAITAEAGYSVGEGNIRGSLIEGVGVTPLDGISPADIQWEVVLNSGMRDSAVAGGLTLTATAVTDIVAVNTPVKVAGVTAPATLNERFDHQNNRLTYTGLNPKLITLSGVVSVDSGNNTALNFYVAKNGVVIAETASRVRVGSGTDERQGTVSALAWAETGDYFEIWVENTTDASDLTCLALRLTASA